MYDNAGKQPYKYNGKEFIEAHGYDVTDLGNRGVYHALNRFTSPDRFAEKFPWQSPYVHAGNNPVNYVDVDGDSIWISYYQDGRAVEKILYTQGMEYSGTNEFFANAVSVLNKMNSVEIGSTVLNTLSASENQFYYTNLDAPNSNTPAATIPDVNNAYFLMGKTDAVIDVAHELFHGYQVEKGVGNRATVTNEVQAYAYSFAVAYNYATEHPLDRESQGILGHSMNFGQRNFAGRLYNENFNALLGAKPYTKQLLSCHSSNDG